MSKASVFTRIKRAYRCQFMHLCTRVLNRLSPEAFYRHPKTITRLWYGSQKGLFPRLNHPRDFNEQLLAINLAAFHDKGMRKIRIQCADKYAVRAYIQSLGLADTLNDCFGVYDSFQEIDFKKLPNQFVLKLTNGSGQNFICRDKSELDLKALESQCNAWLSGSSTFGLKTAEWHYSAIKPRIIAEKYLSSLGDDSSLIDYKFHCFNGRIAGILVCYDRKPELHQGNFDYYDSEWNLTDGILPQYHRHQRFIPKPVSFERMKHIAETVSRGIDYVRVDLYEIDGTPSFGEMTFTPAGNVMSKYRQWVMDYFLKVYKETKDV